jgi:hypothetical protein
LELQTAIFDMLGSGFKSAFARQVEADELVQGCGNLAMD